MHSSGAAPSSSEPPARGPVGTALIAVISLVIVLAVWQILLWLALLLDHGTWIAYLPLILCAANLALAYRARYRLRSTALSLQLDLWVTINKSTS